MAAAKDASSTTNRWMPLREAWERAAKLEFLLPHLRAGYILARHGGLYSPDGMTPKKAEHDRIPAEWWAWAQDIDPEAGRARFAVGDRSRVLNRDGTLTADTLAIGIELERPTVERMFPAVQQPTGPAERKKGPEEWLVWALKEYPRRRDERYKTDHARRLYGFMQKAGNVTEVWKVFETFRRNYFRAIKTDR